MSEAEEWRPVVGWEGLYEVSSLGRVRSLDKMIVAKWRGETEFRRSIRGRVLRLITNRHGYRAGNMSHEGHRANFEAHVLVCRAFHGSPKKGQQVAHGDGDRQNCRASNLRWVTPKQNAADRTSHGNNLEGLRNGRAILTEDEVRKIRSSTETERALMVEYGVSGGAISGIRSGKNWKHLK